MRKLNVNVRDKEMKKTVIGFVAGAVVASVGWYAYTCFLQSKQDLELCGFFAGEAAFAEQLMAQAQNPSEQTRLKTQRTAAHMVESWIRFVDETDRKYPITKARERCGDQYSNAVALVKEWKQAVSNNVLEGIGTNAPNPQH